MDTTPLFEFSDRAELRQWLEENHGTTPLCLVDGGWGVDILAGRRTRRHRDLDIDYVPFPAFPSRDRSSSTQATSCAKNMHHEIYLSDPRKTSADKLKTVIRYPVK